MSSPRLRPGPIPAVGVVYESQGSLDPGRGADPRDALVGTGAGRREEGSPRPETGSARREEGSARHQQGQGRPEGRPEGRRQGGSEEGRAATEARSARLAARQEGRQARRARPQARSQGTEVSHRPGGRWHDASGLSPARTARPSTRPTAPRQSREVDRGTLYSSDLMARSRASFAIGPAYFVQIVPSRPMRTVMGRVESAYASRMSSCP